MKRKHDTEEISYCVYHLHPLCIGWSIGLCQHHQDKGQAFYNRIRRKISDRYSVAHVRDFLSVRIVLGVHRLDTTFDRCVADDPKMVKIGFVLMFSINPEHIRDHPFLLFCLYTCNNRVNGFGQFITDPMGMACIKSASQFDTTT